MVDITGLTSHPTWADVAVRLALAFLAGGLIGLDREHRGNPAGLRTTLLVCLAACVAMIQADLLLPLQGKPATGFAVMDLMRLPLGILTGIGFIGGGAILKRGNLVFGVTTAATLWMATVIGLCLGGGQLGLGVAATVLTLFILWGMKRLDEILPKQHRGSLLLTNAGPAPLRLDAPSLGARSLCLIDCGWDPPQDRQQRRYEVRYQGDPAAIAERVAALAAQPGVISVHWTGSIVDDPSSGAR